jgi:hypothetical protein
MRKLEDTFEEEMKENKLKIEQLNDINDELENRAKELEKILNTTQARYVQLRSKNAVLFLLFQNYLDKK